MVPTSSRSARRSEYGRVLTEVDVSDPCVCSRILETVNDENFAKLPVDQFTDLFVKTNV